MLIDYLKYIGAKHDVPKGVSTEAQALLNILSFKLNRLDDEAIIFRLNKLKKSDSTINIVDFGAGSKKQIGNKRLVSKVAKYASVLPKHGRLFNEIIRHFNIRLSIEMGTSFGIGSAYLAKASEHVITMEGCPETAKIAQETFNILSINNIDINIGEFSASLDKLEMLSDSPIFVYIDGNHKMVPTLDYFQFFKNNAPQNSIIVFDDIYWSNEMKMAWQKIQSDNYFTIDLYRVGILLLQDQSGPIKVTKRY